MLDSTNWSVKRYRKRELMDLSHYSLPGVIAKVEDSIVKVLDKDKVVVAYVAIKDVDAVCALLKAAAKNASTDAVKVIGKPRAKKDAKAS